MIWTSLAGIAAGLVLGFLGAGGTVIAIPILLAGTGTDAHTVLGTNALGVALAACALFVWRYREFRTGLRKTVVFLVPGVVGIYAGASLGLIFPSRRLIFLLGILLFFVAAWIFYLSMRVVVGDPRSKTEHEPGALRLHAWKLAPTAFVVGMTAGFFGIGGGFLIVPALMFAGAMPLELAAVMALLPISAFALTIGVRYLAAGAVVLPWSGIMAVCGVVGGAAGRWLNRRLPTAILQRAFALLLVSIGLYFIAR
jgi:uncharacterized membrane protein YfcA